MTGRVFVGDTPLTFGSVVFQPARGGQPARAEIGSEGKFVLSTYAAADGAVPGKHKVRVLCYAGQDPKSDQEKPRGESLGESLIPIRYTDAATSGIEILILAGGNAPVILKLKPDSSAEALATSESESDELSADSNKSAAESTQESEDEPESASAAEASSEQDAIPEPKEGE